MTCGIYKITNTSNNHFYIGSALDINRRWSRHMSDLRKNRHPNKYIQNSWNKYGEAAFTFSIELECNKETLISQEQTYLDKYFDNQNLCYNLRRVADSNIGCIRSEETRLKYSKAKLGNTYAKGCKGKIVSDETKAKLSKANLGKQHLDSSKQKMSIIRKVGMTETELKRLSELRAGTKHSEETKLQMSNTHKTFSDELMLEVIEYIKTHSWAEASEAYKINVHTLQSRMRKLKHDPKYNYLS
jgi:group I intron endonuclease